MLPTSQNVNLDAEQRHIEFFIRLFELSKSLPDQAGLKAMKAQEELKKTIDKLLDEYKHYLRALQGNQTQQIIVKKGIILQKIKMIRDNAIVVNHGKPTKAQFDDFENEINGGCTDLMISLSKSTDIYAFPDFIGNLEAEQSKARPGSESLVPESNILNPAKKSAISNLEPAKKQINAEAPPDRKMSEKFRVIGIFNQEIYDAEYRDAAARIDEIYKIADDLKSTEINFNQFNWLKVLFKNLILKFDAILNNQKTVPEGESLLAFLSCYDAVLSISEQLYYNDEMSLNNVKSFKLPYINYGRHVLKELKNPRQATITQPAEYLKLCDRLIMASASLIQDYTGTERACLASIEKWHLHQIRANFIEDNFEMAGDADRKQSLQLYYAFSFEDRINFEIRYYGLENNTFYQHMDLMLRMLLSEVAPNTIIYNDADDLNNNNNNNNNNAVNTQSQLLQTIISNNQSEQENDNKALMTAILNSQDVVDVFNYFVSNFNYDPILASKLYHYCRSRPEYCALETRFKQHPESLTEIEMNVYLAPYIIIPPAMVDRCELEFVKKQLTCMMHISEKYRAYIEILLLANRLATNKDNDVSSINDKAKLSEHLKRYQQEAQVDERVYKTIVGPEYWTIEDNNMLLYINFMGINLTGIQLQNCTLVHVCFNNTNLQSADLSGSELPDMTNVNLTNANLTQAHFRTTMLHCQLGNANIQEAEIDEIIFDNCDLSGANLRNVKASDFQFIECNLRNTNLQELNLGGFFKLKNVKLLSHEDCTDRDKFKNYLDAFIQQYAHSPIFYSMVKNLVRNMISITSDNPDKFFELIDIITLSLNQHFMLILQQVNNSETGWPRFIGNTISAERQQLKEKNMTLVLNISKLLTFMQGQVNEKIKQKELSDAKRLLENEAKENECESPSKRSRKHS